MAESYPVYGQDRPRRRWGRRLLITAIVLLLVLAGLLVVADRVAANYAEDRIADEVRQQVAQQQLHSSPPSVTVGGFPFLTQVLDGRYRSIGIVLRDVRGEVSGASVRLPQLDVEARDVIASLDTLRSGQGDVIARTVDGKATISYESVAEFIKQPGVQLSEQNGKLAVTAPLQVLNSQVTVRGTADLTVADGQVRLRFAELAADGLPRIPAAQALVNAYAQQISVAVPLPKLPFRLDVREVRPTPDGLAVTATATDVPINGVA
ncbi:Protein of unknown function [Micromonospora pattaloongensis]|uniref:DUF2993 domain-containing protein n=1 Tax=Micromonospora pattaloongensis TaxID=405436 RepID=A0A1H3GY39_9ACTN|nr:DUF2993 domain-containing protein [Micromonospora pattaloongensis]SDY08047.1 Protein of unknown function [Micromonospora pattaloongensis]